MNNFFSLALLGHNSPWRWFKTEFLTFCYAIVGYLPLLIATIRSTSEGSGFSLTARELGVSDAVFLILLLLPFVTALLGLMRLIHKNHNRSWKTAVTTRPSIDFRRMFLAGGLWILLLLLTDSTIYIFSPELYAWQFDAARFFPALAVVFLMIPLQAFFEEFAMRGYLMQNAALISRWVWQPIFYSTVSFALLHAQNPEVKAHGFIAMMPLYVVFGIIAGIATVMDNGIELAAGAHIANNLYCCMIVDAADSAVCAPSLFIIPSSAPTWFSQLSLLLASLIFLITFAKLYGWTSWSLLWSRIEPPPMSAVTGESEMPRHFEFTPRRVFPKVWHIPTKKPRLLNDIINNNDVSFDFEVMQPSSDQNSNPS